jgi:hypothetical protein
VAIAVAIVWAIALPIAIDCVLLVYDDCVSWMYVAWMYVRGQAASIIDLRSKVDGCSSEMVYVKQQGAQCGASGMKRRAMVGVPLCSGASRGGFGTPHTRVAESQHLVARHTLQACSARLILRLRLRLSQGALFSDQGSSRASSLRRGRWRSAQGELAWL